MNDKERKLNEIKNKKYCSLKEYCLWRGIRYRACSDAIANGRLDGAWVKTKKEYQIYRELADKLWIQNASPHKKIKLREGETVDVQGNGTDQPRASYNKARAVEKTFQAKLAEMSYKKESGKLISVKDVESQFTEVATMIRNSLNNLPSRIMDKIASEKDPYKCESILKYEIESVLEHLNKEFKQ